MGSIRCGGFELVENDLWAKTGGYVLDEMGGEIIFTVCNMGKRMHGWDRDPNDDLMIKAAVV